MKSQVIIIIIVIFIVIVVVVVIVIVIVIIINTIVSGNLRCSTDRLRLFGILGRQSKSTEIRLKVFIEF